MSVIDELIITLGVDPKDVAKGMKQAEGMVNQGVGALKQLIAPLAGAFAFGSLFSGFMEQTQALDKLSKNIRDSVRDIDSWSLAVEKSGGNVNSFQSSLQGFGGKLTQLANTGKSDVTPWLASLGISAKDAGGRIKTTTEMLPEIADKLQKMSLVKAQSVGSKLGLDAETVEYLRKGGDAVKKLASDMQGMAYTAEDVQASKDFNRELSASISSIQRLAAILFRELLPVASKFFNGVAQFASYLREHQGFVVAFFTMLGMVIGSKVTPAIWKMTAAWLANPLTWIIAAIIALALVLEDLWVFINGGDSALGEFWAAMGFGEHTLKELEIAFENFKKVASAIWDVVKAKAIQFFGYFEGAIEPLKKTFIAFGQFISALFKGDFKAAGEAFKEMFINALEFIKQMFVGWIKSIEQMIKDLIGLVPSPDDILDGVKNIGSGISDFITGAFSSGDVPVSSVKASEALPSSSSSSNNVVNDTQLNVAQININVADGDPNKIGGGITGGLNNSLSGSRLVASANTGVNQK